MCDFQTRFSSFSRVFSILFCVLCFFWKTRQHRQKLSERKNKWERTTMANGGLFRNKIFVIKLINDSLSNKKLLKLSFYRAPCRKYRFEGLARSKNCVEIWLRYLMLFEVILHDLFSHEPKHWRMDGCLIDGNSLKFLRVKTTKEPQERKNGYNKKALRTFKENSKKQINCWKL